MRRKLTMTREEALEYMRERQVRRMPGYSRIKAMAELDKLVAAREALKSPKPKKKSLPKKRVKVKKEICRHGRDTWADDCNLCDMFGSDKWLKNSTDKKPRKSLIAIAETVKNHSLQYGIYATSLAEEILRLNKVHSDESV
jgi:hypothetical protein